LSEDQALRLHLAVEECATKFDQILSDMDDDDVDDDLFEAGATIADMWTNLSVLTANKLRALQGWPPIEFPDEGKQ
jgi:hypothetical protein